MNKMRIVRSMSYALTACVLCVGICGCGNSNSANSSSAKSDSPEAVILDVLNTIQSGNGSRDFLAANCTEDCARVWGGYLSALKEDLQGATFTVQSTQIDGNMATVYMNRSGGARSRNGEKFLLKKIDGKWKVMLN